VKSERPAIIRHESYLFAPSFFPLARPPVSPIDRSKRKRETQTTSTTTTDKHQKQLRTAQPYSQLARQTASQTDSQPAGTVVPKQKNRIQTKQVIIMTERRFVYDERLFDECAHSLLAAATTDDDAAEGNDDGVDESCRTLFRLHAAHYGRRLSVTSSDNGDANDGNKEGEEQEEGKRLDAFLKNVVFVYEHNNNNNNNNDGRLQQQPDRHHVALNRFSDRSPDEIFVDDEENGETGGSIWEDRVVRRLVERDYDDDGGDAEDGFVTPLQDEETILGIAEASGSLPAMGIGKGSMNKLTPKKIERIYDDSKVLVVPKTPGETPRPFHSDGEVAEDVDPSNAYDGSILSIRKNKPGMLGEADDDDDVDDDDVDGVPDDDDVDAKDEEGYDESGVYDAEEDPFASHLNWATEDNPDGVPIVHDAFDQVRATLTRLPRLRTVCCPRINRTACFAESTSPLYWRRADTALFRARADHAGHLPPPDPWRLRRRAETPTRLLRAT